MARPYGIGLYAPAGFVIDEAAIDRAIAYFETLGHRVVVDPSVGTRWERFAATDDERLAAVMRMAEDARVDIAIAVRGGYGWSRLLDRLDLPAIAASGKRWLGHSDFTAFQLAMLAKRGVVTFAGPMAAYDFGADHRSTFTMDHCWQLLDNRENTIEFELAGATPLAATGTLWGGNLAMVAHLAGTPYMPRIQGGILFLEDIGEHPYRVERMLYQLRFAGILGAQQAVLLGCFNGYELGRNDNGYDMASMVEHAQRTFGVPVCTGLPFGHCADKLTLPVGAQCVLRVRDGMARMTLSDYQA
jgi:muramoyltetrapeptide carboxypeptidase